MSSLLCRVSSVRYSQFVQYSYIVETREDKNSPGVIELYQELQPTFPIDNEIKTENFSYETFIEVCKEIECYSKALNRKVELHGFFFLLRLFYPDESVTAQNW